MGRIFLAGASGVIGRRLVPLLRRAGHDVVGTTRSPGRADALRRLGAEPVIVDVFDEAALTAALVAASPQVIIDQLTDLPSNPDPARAAEYVAANARLRATGTAHLIRAALKSGAGRVIAQSIGWAYAPAGTPRAEQDPLDTEATGTRAVTVRGVLALEACVLDAAPMASVVLRYGALYGPGTGSEHPSSDAAVVHVDAAAHAAVLALRATALGIFNIAEPGPRLNIDRALSILGWRPEFRLAA